MRRSRKRNEEKKFTKKLYRVHTNKITDVKDIHKIKL